MKYMSLTTKGYGAEGASLGGPACRPGQNDSITAIYNRLGRSRHADDALAFSSRVELRTHISRGLTLARTVAVKVLPTDTC